MIFGCRRNSSSAFRRTESPLPKSGRLWRCGEVMEVNGVFLTPIWRVWYTLFRKFLLYLYASLCKYRFLKPHTWVIEKTFGRHGILVMNLSQMLDTRIRIPYFLKEPNRSQVHPWKWPTNDGTPRDPGRVYMSVVLPCTTWRRALLTAQMVTSVDVGGDFLGGCQWWICAFILGRLQTSSNWRFMFEMNYEDI